jgi:hypothetical protein
VPATTAAEARAQIQHTLPGGQPLPCSGFEEPQFGVIIRGSDVLYLPPPAMVGVHDLNRRPARRHLNQVQPPKTSATRPVTNLAHP